MGKYRDSKWYDDYYASNADKIRDQYLPLYHYIIDRIPDDKVVLDLGCGPGIFAREWFRLYDNRYAGYDFSKVSIDQARERNPLHKHDFYCMNILSAPGQFGNFFVVCTEVMEHLKDNDDIKLLKKYWQQPIIFSVPDHDSSAHVRHFKTEEEVRERYSGHTNISWIKSMKAGNWIIWVVGCNMELNTETEERQ